MVWDSKWYSRTYSRAQFSISRDIILMFIVVNFEYFLFVLPNITCNVANTLEANGCGVESLFDMVWFLLYFVNIPLMGFLLP